MPSRLLISMPVVASIAASAGAVERYWVAPLIGFWDDAGNWSLTEGGPVGGGIPQNGDVVRMTTRSTSLFDGQLGLPIQSITILAGTGSGQGRTLLSQSAGLLRCETIRVGNGTVRNDLKVSGGSLNANAIYVGEFGGEGLLEISGTGSVGPIVTQCDLLVGFSNGSGLVDIRGGSANFDDVILSVDSNLGSPGGPADLVMTDGTLDINEFTVGLGGRGFARFFGGITTISDSCTVGFVAESGGLRPQMNVAGGDVDIFGPLTIGDFEQTVGEEPGDGRVLVTNGTLTVDETRIANTIGTSGELIVDGGVVETGSIRVGLGGFGSVRLDSGSLEIANDAIIAAAGVLSGGDLEINNGSFIANDLRVGAVASAVGSVTINNGSVDTSAISIGSAAGSLGTVEMAGGTVTADSIIVGNSGRGTWTMQGGTIDTDVLSIANAGPVANSSLTQFGGTVLADQVIIRPNTSANTPEYQIQDGVLVSQSVTIMPGAEAFWIQQVDARVSTITNNGTFTFGGGQAKLSGPLLGPPFNTRLLGDFINNGELDASTVGGLLFAMDLFNNGTIDQFDDSLRISGSIVNDGMIELTNSFYDGFGAIALSSLSPQGIVNNADLVTRFVRIDAPNGEIVNNGTMTGFARMLAPFTNNGALLPDPSRIDENLLEIDGGFTSGPASSARFVITETGHNSIMVTGGDIDLDGTVNVAFAQGVPLPPRGTEYDLVTCADGVINGNFASEAILGFPCEIVYEPTRVFARALRCNVADFAQPFGVLDLADIGVFTSGFTGGNPLVDINGDTILDLADIGLFVAAFTAGCP